MQLPCLYSQENNKAPVVHVKFFCPWSNWTWFASEGAEEDGDYLFFGYRRQHDTNVLGLLLATKAALPYFPSDGGSIVNVSFVAKHPGSVGRVRICSDKGRRR